MPLLSFVDDRSGSIASESDRCRWEKAGRRTREHPVAQDRVSRGQDILAERVGSVKPRQCARHAVHNRPFRHLFTFSTGQPSYWRDAVTLSEVACTYDLSAIRSHHRNEFIGERKSSMRPPSRFVASERR